VSSLAARAFHFILVCLPDSHKTLYEHLEALLYRRAPTLDGKTEETYTYRYLNQVPLRDDDDALLVNWCELTVTRADGKQLYKNAFATDHWITDQTVEAIVQSGRTRWKVENENNNTLKTKAATWNTTSGMANSTSPHYSQRSTSCRSCFIRCWNYSMTSTDC